MKSHTSCTDHFTMTGLSSGATVGTTGMVAVPVSIGVAGAVPTNCAAGWCVVGWSIVSIRSSLMLDGATGLTVVVTDDE